EQAAYWFARLAQGQAAGCVASFVVENDIVPIQATGVVLTGDGDSPVLRLNWSGARHPAGPKPELLVLPFRLHDPQGLLGPAGERGVCVALVDTGCRGVHHHRVPFAGTSVGGAGRETSDAQSDISRGGLFDGRDVELSLDALLGGSEALESALSAVLAEQSASKGISMPALASASVALSAHAASAVKRLQGDGSGGARLGSRSRLGRLAATTYRVEAARRFLCAGLDLGYRPMLAAALVDIAVLDDVRGAMGDSMQLLGCAGATPALSEWQESLHALLPALFGLDGLAAQGRN